jgi:hypothetical protein
VSTRKAISEKEVLRRQLQVIEQLEPYYGLQEIFAGTIRALLTRYAATEGVATLRRFFNWELYKWARKTAGRREKAPVVPLHESHIE